MNDSSIIQFKVKDTDADGQGDIVVTPTHAFISFADINHHADIEIYTITPEIYERFTCAQTRESAVSIIRAAEYISVHQVLPLTRG